MGFSPKHRPEEAGDESDGPGDDSDDGGGTPNRLPTPQNPPTGGGAVSDITLKLDKGLVQTGATDTEPPSVPERRGRGESRATRLNIRVE